MNVKIEFNKTGQWDTIRRSLIDDAIVKVGHKTEAAAREYAAKCEAGYSHLRNVNR